MSYKFVYGGDLWGVHVVKYMMNVEKITLCTDALMNGTMNSNDGG